MMRSTCLDIEKETRVKKLVVIQVESIQITISPEHIILCKKTRKEWKIAVLHLACLA